MRLQFILGLLPPSTTPFVAATWGHDGFSFAYDEEDRLLRFPSPDDLHTKLTLQLSDEDGDVQQQNEEQESPIVQAPLLSSLTKRLPQQLYTSVLKNTPIACVDVLLYNPAFEKYLVLRRDQHPIKNKLAYIGGRLHVGESIHDGALRKVREEIFGGEEGRVAAQRVREWKAAAARKEDKGGVDVVPPTGDQVLLSGGIDGGVSGGKEQGGAAEEVIKPTLILHDVVSVYNTMFENSAVGKDAVGKDIPTQTVNTLVFAEIWAADEMVGWKNSRIVGSSAASSREEVVLDGWQMVEIFL